MSEQNLVEVKPRVEVITDPIKDIPRSEGKIVFNPGHAKDLKPINDKYPDLFEDVSTKYESTQNGDYYSLDMRALAESKLGYDRDFLRVLVNITAEQLRTEATTALGYKALLAKLGDNEEVRSLYEWGRSTYLMNLQTFKSFAESTKLDHNKVGKKLMTKLKKAYSFEDQIQ